MNKLATAVIAEELQKIQRVPVPTIDMLWPDMAFTVGSLESVYMTYCMGVYKKPSRFSSQSVVALSRPMVSCDTIDMGVP